MTIIQAPVNSALQGQIVSAAQAAGLEVFACEPSIAASAIPTLRFTLAPAAALAPTAEHPHTFTLELSQTFDPAPFASELAVYLKESAQRLRNPQPDLYLTLSGLPLRFSAFTWPFHESTAGADTSLVHGQAALVDGHGSPLHAKLAASMTVTFREALLAPEQPFAESHIFNAIRKTFDQGQLELVRSGNRQPVPVTTRYYSARHNKFVFTDTTEPQRTAFLAAKAFWLSGVLTEHAAPVAQTVDGQTFGAEGGHTAPAPVWLLDPRDAQYLNATVDELKPSFAALVQEGLIAAASDPGFALPTETLLAREPLYRAERQEALAFIKPTFNEDMRGGHTNM